MKKDISFQTVDLGQEIWLNKKNNNYYETITADQIKELYGMSGIENNPDLQIIFPHIQNSQSILEVGAGYGRALDFLLKKGYSGKMTAVERCEKFYSYLKKNFSENVEIHHADLCDFETGEKFDVILWLWCGISDFSQQEQPLMVKKLSDFLTKDGLIIIDIVPLSGQQARCQNRRLERNDSVLYRYLPNATEIENYAKQAMLYIKSDINYSTSTSSVAKTRTLYFLGKKTKK